MTTSESSLFTGLRGPREIIFGSGQRRCLPGVLQKFGSRVFLCVDPHLVDHPDVVEVMDQIRGQGLDVALFADVVPELPIGTVDEAVAAAQGHHADVILAIGGGSSIDLAKVVACQLAHPGPLQDVFGEFNVPGPVLPLVAVPTTAGTGSEATPVAVLTDTERGVKAGVSSPYLIPTVALCDPELTLTCPAGVTAASGTDALAHCIESFTAIRRTPETGFMDRRVFIGASPLTSALALEGIEAVVTGLDTAYRQPEDLAAREQVMYGSLLGGLAFGTAGNAAAHAIQYPIGAETKTAHGVGIGLLLPYVMQYNSRARIPEFAQIATMLRSHGTSGSQDIRGATSGAKAADNTSDAERAAEAPALVQDYLRALDIPQTLADIGFAEDRIPWAAEQGIAAARLSENNPVPLDAHGAESILRAAATGDLQQAS